MKMWESVDLADVYTINVWNGKFYVSVDVNKGVWTKAFHDGGILQWAVTYYEDDRHIILSPYRNKDDDYFQVM